MAVIALAMIGLGVGGWIGVGLAALLLKGRFKLPLGVVFAVGGIVAAVVASDLVIPKPRAPEMLAHAEKHDPEFQLLMRIDPTRHEAILRHLEKAARRGGEAEVARELRFVAFEIMAVHGIKLIPQASDAAADGYISAMAQYLQSIHERDPEMCYVFLAESSHGSDYGMSPRIYDQIFASMRAIVASAASNPDPMTDDEREAAQERFEQIRTGLEEGPETADFYTGAMGGDTQLTPEQRKGACLFVTRLYQRFVVQESPMRAHVLKAYYE